MDANSDELPPSSVMKLESNLPGSTLLEDDEEINLPSKEAGEPLKPPKEGREILNEGLYLEKAKEADNITPLDVVISGAGPAGLLLAHYLLDKGHGRFRVSFFERRGDPRKMRSSSDPGVRRYSIGLSKRGQAAVASIPGLWDALQAAGVYITNFSYSLFGRNYSAKIPEESAPLAIDRMELCAVLFEQLLEKHGESDLLKTTFNARCTGVDVQGHVADFEDVTCPNGERWHVPYGLLVGADGVRSRVRLAMLENCWKFDMEQRTLDIATVMTYIPLPESIAPGTILRISALPKCKSLGVFLFLASTSKVCLTLGWSDTSPPQEWFALKDATEAKAWLTSQIPWMEHVPEEAIADLRAQKPFPTNAVKCSRYHDVAASVALIGDAAHASPPFIGQGCNVALEDAAALAHLLLCASGMPTSDETATRLAKLCSTRDAPESPKVLASGQLAAALEVYSALRVPEGHALVDLSESRAAHSTAMRIRMAASEMWQNFLFFASRGFLSRGPVRAQAGGTTDPLADILERNEGEVRSVLDSNARIRESWLKKQREVKLKEGLAALLA